MTNKQTFKFGSPSHGGIQRRALPPGWLNGPSICSQILVFLVLCGSAVATDARIVKDIAYRSDNEPDAYARSRCKLDLYLPPTGTGFPCVVWFHGGGLESGAKEGERQWGVSLAKAGIAMAAVNYRLSPEVQYPAYIEDAAAAVAWVYANIREQGGDPRSVFVSGHSAGGYLTGMLAIDKRWLAAAGMEANLVAGAIPVSGQMITHSTVRKERGIPRSIEVVDEAAPLHHVRADVPPMLLITGDHDMAGRSAENRRIHEALVEAGCNTTIFQEFKDRDHGSIMSRMKDTDDPARLAFLAFIMENRRQ